MTTIPALKQLPTPVRSLIRPMLFAAIGLHALLLFTPMPSEEKPKKPDDKENPVKITQLPTAKPTTRPKLAKPVLPKIDRPKPAIAPPVQKTQTPQRSAGGTPSDAKDPFADFPHYQPSTPNCYGKTDLGENCREASVSLQSVVSYFEKALPDKKFTLTPAGGDGTNVKIFTVTKGSKSLSLSILKDSDTKTVYLLAPEAIQKLEDLKKAEGIPSELSNIAKELDSTYGTSPDDSAIGMNVSDKDSFFEPDKDNPSNELTVSGIQETRVIPNQEPTQVYKSLQTALKGFDVSEAAPYGGGSLYILKKGSFTGGLSLVPSKTGGTVAVIWKQKPPQ